MSVNDAPFMALERNSFVASMLALVFMSQVELLSLGNAALSAIRKLVSL